MPIEVQELKSWLSPKQVADKYGLARQNVLLACTSGRFTDVEAVETSIGWLISPAAADRIWRYRITGSEFYRNVGVILHHIRSIDPKFNSTANEDNILRNARNAANTVNQIKKLDIPYPSIKELPEYREIQNYDFSITEKEFRAKFQGLLLNYCINGRAADSIYKAEVPADGHDHS